MILLIGGDRATSERLAAALPDRSIERVSADTDVHPLLDGEGPRLAFVDATAVDPESPVLATLRDHPAGPALVAITAPGEPADGTVYDDYVETPLDADRIRTAAEQAVLAHDYRAAVSVLYDLCQERAEDATIETPGVSEEIRAARRAADEKLATFREGIGDEFERLFRDD